MSSIAREINPSFNHKKMSKSNQHDGLSNDSNKQNKHTKHMNNPSRNKPSNAKKKHMLKIRVTMITCH